MQQEIIKVLSDIKEVNLISNILLNMTSRDIYILQSLLDFTDTETQSRWLNTYSKLLKINI